MAVLEQLRAARRDPALAVLEGFHALKHALRFGADVVFAATDDPPLAARLATELAPDLGLDRVLRPLEPGALGPGAHHTRVVAVVRRPAFVAPPRGTGPVVALENPRHPGNLGAVVRVRRSEAEGEQVFEGGDCQMDLGAIAPFRAVPACPLPAFRRTLQRAVVENRRRGMWSSPQNKHDATAWVAARLTPEAMKVR